MSRFLHNKQIFLSMQWAKSVAREGLISVSSFDEVFD
jgi:hypothetical protein